MGLIESPKVGKQNQLGNLGGHTFLTQTNNTNIFTCSESWTWNEYTQKMAA